MALTKGDLEAIEWLVRLTIGDKLGGITKGLTVSLSALDVRLSGIEKKLEAGLAEFSRDLQSLRDAVSQ